MNFFWDKSTIEVMGKGDIQIKIRNGFIEIISNVFYIPDLKTNLLSACLLQEKGYRITSFKGECEVSDSKRGSISKIKMTSNRLFPLKITTVNDCLLAKAGDSSWNWHYRYKHLNFNGLRTLHQRQMVTGLPAIIPPSKICEECIIGKHQRILILVEKLKWVALYLNWCIQTYADHSIQLQMVIKYILYHLLMTLAGKL